MRRDTGAAALLGPLLAGSAQPHQVRRAAQGLGLPERGRYAVVVLGAPAVVPEAGGDGVRWCWCGEAGVVLLGPGGLAGPVARLGEAGAGPGGVSPVVGGLAELGLARRLAGAALLACGPGAREIVALDERLPAALVASVPELSARLVAEVFGPLLVLAPAERALLVGTLEAWLECGGSVGRAAARLRCHRNTVFNRLRRLERLTSRSLSHPRELVETVLALEALRLPAARG
ncbi:helix-turn-helix domain-containing protein [Streptomyces cyaneofuscatus]|uniref:Helix-turn-helix domain-containing protein n=1 Tax=Streptomyces cyaneofuscatus TaxID=66883 RepID=A0ABZ1F4M0_9ACTN|nr:helix-turn-helix domain-containing protein [Streptomyces cyaneofuscatus]WSB11367.1 helix-turn-helix domain-containing protein [Streptomyces cyaneofuscatus]WSD45099.1 helix-turn-helix domain-containing protein [Streptomyces cyaneofuscatus]WTA88293.1 helix-turn-helix domain-containing protein [Streptomyces cyaneofuscatus]